METWAVLTNGAVLMLARRSPRAIVSPKRGGSAAKDGGKESRVQDALWGRERSLKDSRGFLSGVVVGEAGMSGWLVPAWAPG